MLIKGEKYACEACVRGHRVSNCQHADRPLQHINKKGRPVSQCTHCRTLRKSRSAHVRCDCGGDKSHTKSSCSTEVESQADSCCCSHGARCSCALKKEHLDPVPESDSDEPTVPAVPNDRRRPRASTAQSENSLTTFVNGHHKPVHKHNTMAHKCGLPYVVPRSHTIHGLSSTGLANRSVDNLPHTNAVENLHSDSHIKDSIVSAQQEQRMVKSEHGSPIISPVSSLNQWNSNLPPLDLSNLSGDYVSCLDGFSSVPDDQPLFSAGLSAASIDWSHYDGLDFNNDTFATSSYSQAPSFTGFDFSSIEQPALTTTSTSGEISEVEDFGSLGDVSNANTRPSLLTTTKYGSDFDTSDIGGELDGYRLSTASSYVGIPQAQMLAGNNVDALDMETFLKGGVSSGNGYSNVCDGLPATSYPSDGKLAQLSPYEDSTNFPLLSADDDAFWMNNFTPNNYTTNDACGNLSEENIWTQ
ncbi:Zinc copper-regulated transcription factor [Glarea lozoyensis ATCC 20868]|uniref:Zinc copper-regulated transcription factor n=1 Tax=Glarea lozoyensis (strain ATCC 20868 / MF5171) TaxID=1116229 RepID=S3DJJ3_GLAL2|nr:Zinc copper-regulated transcription factor [Glarea lozoyensis ATCC 20868]EPE26718.1 Zinc copper-regulated transcription factor [Glarea lozoyensis ATCC 20868]